MSVRLLVGDCRDTLRSLASGSVQCCVTSPPYYNLRDYGVEGQLGLEPTPGAYIANMVEVFREVRRVLRDDGTLWLNIGDSYAANRSYQVTDNKHIDVGNAMAARVPDGLKPKDLIGIPWLLAFALRADGWWLRMDCVWSKPNPMPESVAGSRWERHMVDGGDEREPCPGCPKCEETDGLIFRMSAGRPTKAHEYLFLLTKSESYYYDADAIREPVSPSSDFGRVVPLEPMPSTRGDAVNDRRIHARLGNGSVGSPAGRNKRSVWEIATQPYAGAHFAVFPTALVEPCLRAGTSERGQCPECGAPWARVVERTPMVVNHSDRVALLAADGYRTQTSGTMVQAPSSVTTGWRATCAHDLAPVPQVCLDPFGGSGTVAQVADRLGRDAILCELNPSYGEQAVRRVTSEAPMFTEMDVA